MAWPTMDCMYIIKWKIIKFPLFYVACIWTNYYFLLRNLYVYPKNISLICWSLDTQTLIFQIILFDQFIYIYTFFFLFDFLFCFFGWDEMLIYYWPYKSQAQQAWQRYMWNRQKNKWVEPDFRSRKEGSHAQRESHLVQQNLTKSNSIHCGRKSLSNQRRSLMDAASHEIANIYIWQ